MNIFKNTGKKSAMMILLAVVLTSTHAQSVDPIPVISGLEIRSESLDLSISNLTSGGTYTIERSGDLLAADWSEVDSFEGATSSTNWTEMLSAASTSAFYRIVLDPYHEKVGQSASLDTPGFHDVSGTAHIINNRTIELRNFSYDGKGIVVQVYISPNPNFSPYIAISDDLFGTVFANETLTLSVPEGTDPDYMSYISIWCVAADASFGDGMFQPVP